MTTAPAVLIRQTESRDDAGIVRLTKAVYPDTPPWSPVHLASHRAFFPEGQFVAVVGADGPVVGMAASLVILWDDYEIDRDWQHFTQQGMFTNHDSEHGRTLYGAEVMVDPAMRGRGIGKRLYAARRDLTRRLGLLRIRAGARLRGYHRFAHDMSAEQYAIEVVQGRLSDPTLTFQIKEGFHVLAVVSDYLHHDSESLGHAAVIEWINPDVGTPRDYAGRDPRFRRLQP